MISAGEEGGGKRQPLGDKNEEEVCYYIFLLPSISAPWMEIEE